MSYYDRLQKVIQEQEGGSAKVQQALDLAKMTDQADITQQQSNVGTLMTGEVNKFAEEFGIKQASKLVLKGVGKKFIVPRIKAQRVQLNKDINLKKGQIAEGKQTTTEVTNTGQGRIANPADNEPAYKMGDGSIVGESDRPTAVSAQGTRVETGEEMEGKVVPKGTKAGDDVEPFDASTGLTEAETARLAGIKDFADTAGEDIAKMGAKTLGEQALDAIPVVGEVLMMGAMFGGMIHSGHHAHVQQMADEATEKTDLQNEQSAQLYSGFNRPSFGSMALPSFDTSKNPAMLQE